jgi:hypothetical protein
MKGHRAISRLLVPMLLGSALAPEGFAAPKSEVAVFQYAGVVEGHTSGEQFSVFRGILNDKILQLRREVLQGDSQALAYLNDVHVSFRDKDSFTTTEGINKWLKNQGSVLCVLRGTIISDDDATYMVKSNIHLGELRGHFPYDVVRITLPISVKEFSNSRDSHSVVILYALAMDAKRLGYDRSHVARFLTAANNKLADITRRGGQVGSDLADLEKAIRAASAELLGEQ